MAFSQDNLPAAVQVPAGHKVALETVGVGQITYACRAKKDMVGQFEWVFAGPDAKLLNRMGKQVGGTTAHPLPGKAWTAPSSRPPSSPWRRVAWATFRCNW